MPNTNTEAYFDIGVGHSFVILSDSEGSSKTDKSPIYKSQKMLHCVQHDKV